MNWLDWLFILIIVFFGWKGLRKGFIYSISKLAGIVAGLVIAYTKYKSLANYLDIKLGWGSSVATFLQEKIPLALLEQYNQKISILDLLLTPFYDPKQNPSLQQLPGNILTLVNHLSTIIIEAAAFMLLLFATSIVIRIIMGIISRTVVRTFFSPFDHVAGLFLGLARGVLTVMILVMIGRFVILNNEDVMKDRQGFINNGIAGSKLYSYTCNLMNNLDLSVPVWPKL